MIPNFGSTKEALVWGLANLGNREAILDLKYMMLQLQLDHDIAEEKNMIQKSFDIAFLHQFVHEALETATGQLQMQYLSQLPAESLVMDI